MSLYLSGRLELRNRHYLSPTEETEVVEEEEDLDVLRVRAYFHNHIVPNKYTLCDGKSTFAQKLIMQGYIPVATATVQTLEANPSMTDDELTIELTKILGEKDVVMFVLKHKA